MTRTLLALAATAALLSAFAACDEVGTTARDAGPDAPACTVAAVTEGKAACLGFRDALCERSLECGHYPAREGCDEWFARSYGDCDKAGGTLTAAQSEAWVACLCGLPNSSCQAIEDLGVEVAIPECKNF